jgi:TonB family protein
MKTLIYVAIFAVVTLWITTDALSSGQRRRTRPDMKKIDVKETEEGTPEERAKLIEECSSPDRPKPEVEIGTDRNALLCGKVVNLPKPAYPEEAKAQKISGTVSINVVIDERGRVIWAKAVDGHPLLQNAALKAACRSQHSPLKISGRAVKASGLISYHFVSQ